jgi:Xaa-Pro aminopeptidase
MADLLLYGDTERSAAMRHEVPAAIIDPLTFIELGHGVSLEVHEEPGLGLSGRSPLVAGDVLAIEPGLWDSQFGEVRFEDLLLVTDDGCETLTRYPYGLSP